MRKYKISSGVSKKVTKKKIKGYRVKDDKYWESIRRILEDQVTLGNLNQGIIFFLKKVVGMINLRN